MSEFTVSQWVAAFLIAAVFVVVFFVSIWLAWFIVG